MFGCIKSVYQKLFNRHWNIASLQGQDPGCQLTWFILTQSVMDYTGFVVVLSMALIMWKFCSCFQFCIFTAPFHYVGFADFWVADQLNSLTTLLLDLEYLVCFYAIEVDWLGSNSKCVQFFH